MKELIGIVIPIYQTKFIENIVSKIIATTEEFDVEICIVNDGKENVKSFLSERQFPENVHIINLEENQCFAGANNIGWKYLTEENPEIKYLMTINDDTIPYNGWLGALMKGIKKYPNTALVAPIMETDTVGWKKLFKKKTRYSTWKLSNEDIMRNVSSKMKNDTFVSVIPGFCFLADRISLEKVNFFDVRYQNSCEDVDLSIKLLKEGKRLLICKDSIVFHYGGASRYLSDTNTDIDASHKLLHKKWGANLEQYNDLIGKKIIVHAPIYNQEHFIDAWVNNANEYADEIIALYSPYPWSYNKDAMIELKPDSTGKRLESLRNKYPKLHIFTDTWKNETVQRNKGIEYAKYLEGDILLIVDCDEMFEKKEIFNAIMWMEKNKADFWFMNHIQLIKNFQWSIITPDGLPKFQFALNLHSDNSFKDKRTITKGNSLIIPDNICKCWHLSYLMPKNKLEEKLKSFGHSNEIQKNWLSDIWPKIDLDARDFHPVNPKGWKEIKTVEVPKQIVELFRTSVEWRQFFKDVRQDGES